MAIGRSPETGSRASWASDRIAETNVLFISTPAGALQSQSNASHIINNPSRMPTTRSLATASDDWNLNSSKFIRQKAAAICSPRYESRGLEVAIQADRPATAT